MMLRFRTKTFQELVDDITLEGVFAGTSVDEATQGALLEWLFDYPLCADDATFLRYFRRKLNNVYPLYQARLRVSTVKDNMDPFIVDFMERLHADRSTIQGRENGVRSDSGTASDGYTTTVTDEFRRDPHLTDTLNATNTRTPNLTKTEDSTKTDISGGSTTSNGTETRDIGSSSNVRESEDRRLRSLTTNTGTEERNNDVTEESTSSAESKSRAFNVQYPEANLGDEGGVPSSVDNYPASIDYVSDEADTLGSSETTSNGSREDSTIVNTSSTNDTSDTGNVSKSTDSSGRESGTIGNQSVVNTNNSDTATGHTSAKETGTDTNVSRETSTKGGYETTNGTTTTINTKTGSNEREESSSKDTTQTKNGRVEEIEQGRHESVVDILPRAIRAIVSTNDLKWLVDQCLTCFDTYSYME